MKHLEQAVRLYCALVESKSIVRPASLWSWEAVQEAIAHDPDLITDLGRLEETDRDRVLRYTGSFSPLESLGSLYVFPSVESAESFSRCVETAGGTAEPYACTIIHAYGDDMDLVAIEAAEHGGSEWRGPNIRESVKQIDTDLPWDMHTDGIPIDVVRECVLRAVREPVGFLAEGERIVGNGAEAKFEGRLRNFYTPREFEGVPAQVTEALRVGGFLSDGMYSALLSEQEPDKQATTAAPRGQGGVADTQPDQTQGGAATSQSEPAQEPEKPTEHVPTGEEGAPDGDVTLPDGTVVPKEVLKDAFVKFLDRIKARLQSGGGMGAPEPRDTEDGGAAQREEPQAQAQQQPMVQQQKKAQQAPAQQAPAQQQAPAAQQQPPQESIQEQGRYAITGKGLRAISGDEILLQPDHIYFMGASSSPDMIIVTNAGKDRITYRRYPWRKDHRMEKWIAVDLISQGTQRWLRSSYSQYDPELKRALEGLLAGKPSPLRHDPRDFQRIDVTVEKAPGYEDKDLWGDAAQYGDVGGIGDISRGGGMRDLTGYVITMTRKDLPKLKGDRRFNVLDVEDAQTFESVNESARVVGSEAAGRLRPGQWAAFDFYRFDDATGTKVELPAPDIGRVERVDRLPGGYVAVLLDKYYSEEFGEWRGPKGITLRPTDVVPLVDPTSVGESRESQPIREASKDGLPTAEEFETLMWQTGGTLYRADFQPHAGVSYFAAFPEVGTDVGRRGIGGRTSRPNDFMKALRRYRNSTPVMMDASDPLTRPKPGTARELVQAWEEADKVVAAFVYDPLFLEVPQGYYENINEAKGEWEAGDTVRNIMNGRIGTIVKPIVARGVRVRWNDTGEVEDVDAYLLNVQESTTIESYIPVVFPRGVPGKRPIPEGVSGRLVDVSGSRVVVEVAGRRVACAPERVLALAEGYDTDHALFDIAAGSDVMEVARRRLRSHMGRTVGTAEAAQRAIQGEAVDPMTGRTPVRIDYKVGGVRKKPGVIFLRLLGPPSRQDEEAWKAAERFLAREMPEAVLLDVSQLSSDELRMIRAGHALEAVDPMTGRTPVRIDYKVGGVRKKPGVIFLRLLGPPSRQDEEAWKAAERFLAREMPEAVLLDVSQLSSDELRMIRAGHALESGPVARHVIVDGDGRRRPYERVQYSDDRDRLEEMMEPNWLEQERIFRSEFARMLESGMAGAAVTYMLRTIVDTAGNLLRKYQGRAVMSGSYDRTWEKQERLFIPALEDALVRIAERNRPFDVEGVANETARLALARSQVAVEESAKKRVGRRVDEAGRPIQPGTVMMESVLSRVESAGKRLLEELDTGEDAEREAAAKGFADAAEQLKKLRAAAFQLTTDDLVRLTSLMQALNNKGAASKVEKLRSTLAGLSDTVKQAADELKKAHGAAGVGALPGEGEQQQAQQQAQQPQAAPQQPGQQQPAQQQAQQAPAQQAPAQQAPAESVQEAGLDGFKKAKWVAKNKGPFREGQVVWVMTEGERVWVAEDPYTRRGIYATPYDVEMIERDYRDEVGDRMMEVAILRVLDGSIPSRIQEGEDYGDVAPSILAVCSDLGLSADQVSEVHRVVRHGNSKMFTVSVDSAAHAAMASSDDPVVGRLVMDTDDGLVARVPGAVLMEVARVMRKGTDPNRVRVAEVLEGVLTPQDNSRR